VPESVRADMNFISAETVQTVFSNSIVGCKGVSAAGIPRYPVIRVVSK
jgi:hypothetical protein